MSERARSERCPPDSSVSESFHTPPNATRTSRPGKDRPRCMHECVCGSDGQFVGCYMHLPDQVYYKPVLQGVHE
jgi:hypothetical protein